MFISSVTESQIIAAIVSIGAFLVIYLFSGIAGMLSSSAKTSFFCLAALALIIGLLLYSLTKNQTIGIGFALIALVALVVIYLAKPQLLEGVFPLLLTKLAIFSRVGNFTSGLLDITGIIYYLSVSLFFGLLTVQSIEKRRWS